MANDPKESLNQFERSLAKNNQLISAFFAARKHLEAEVRGRYRYLVKSTQPADENLTLLEMCKYELLQEQTLLSSPMATDEMIKKLPQIKADLLEVNALLAARKNILRQFEKSSSLIKRLKRWLAIADYASTHSSSSIIQIKNVGEIITSSYDESSSTQSISKTWEVQVFNEDHQPETSTINITTVFHRQELTPDHDLEPKKKSNLK